MKNKLHPGIKWQWRLSSYFGYLFFILFFGIWIGAFVGVFIGKPLLTIFLFSFFLLIFLIILTEIWIYLAFNRWFYEFTDTNLKQERGVIWKTYSNVPYEKIQNVDIRRGIIARIMGFSAVHIQTAGYSATSQRYGYGSEGYIPAVNIGEAERIRDFIMKKTTQRTKGGL